LVWDGADEVATPAVDDLVGMRSYDDSGPQNFFPVGCADQRH